jgi:flagellar motility protein MotE (MotC chaperone)
LPAWDGEPIALDARDTDVSLARQIDILNAKLQEGRKRAGLGSMTKHAAEEKLQKATKIYEGLFTHADIHIYMSLMSCERCLYHITFKPSDALRNIAAVTETFESLGDDIESRKKSWTKRLKGNAKQVKTSFNTYLQGKKSRWGDMT